jgi:2-keto-4-pentenoate hydratase
MKQAPFRRHPLSFAAVTLGVALLAGCASAPPPDPTCPADAEIAEMTTRYLARQPLAVPPASMTFAGGVCGRDKFTRALARSQGPVVGYKAGLTNAAVQKRFGYPAPVRGTLFQKMMLRDGVEIDAKFGARPTFEADLVAVVKSSAIHDAKTPLEALAQVSVLYPFIELPDLMLEDPSKINGPGIALINVGARYGVLGAPIPVQPTEAMLAMLRDMTVRLVDASGKELDSGKGGAILGQPIEAVLWLAGDLRKSGITLKQGDLLSLGSFTRLLPPQPGPVRAVYEGLPGNPSVGVTFR